MFLTIWNLFGPVWTLLDHFKRNMNFCSKAPLPNPSLSLWGNKLIFVWNGPKVSRWAQKGNKLSKTSRLTISDPFGSLWTTGILTSLTCLAIIFVLLVCGVSNNCFAMIFTNSSSNQLKSVIIPCRMPPSRLPPNPPSGMCEDLGTITIRSSQSCYFM